MADETPRHKIEVIWKQRPLRTEAQVEAGKEAALKALDDGRAPGEAVNALIRAMYGGGLPVFDGFVVMIDGQRYG